MRITAISIRPGFDIHGGRVGLTFDECGRFTHQILGFDPFHPESQLILVLIGSFLRYGVKNSAGVRQSEPGSSVQPELLVGHGADGEDCGEIIVESSINFSASFR